MATSKSRRFRAELEQFDAMYRTLSGDYFEPLQPVVELQKWRREQLSLDTVFRRVTKELTTDHSLNPFREEPLEQVVGGLKPRGYRLRYVCRPLGNAMPCFSLGIRDPFASANTPIWLRFHRATAEFPVILDRLECSDLREQLGRTGGHVWIPLHVQLEQSTDEMVSAVLEQAEEVLKVAYAEIALGPPSGP